MTTRTAVLLLSLATPALAVAVGCQATEFYAVGFANSAVPVEAVTYRVVTPAPPSLEVMNLGDNSVAVSVRERPEGPVVLSFQLQPGDAHTATIDLPRFFIVLSASPNSSSINLAVTIPRESGEGVQERPELTVYRAGED